MIVLLSVPKWCKSNAKILREQYARSARIFCTLLAVLLHHFGDTWEDDHTAQSLAPSLAHCAAELRQSSTIFAQSLSKVPGNKIDEKDINSELLRVGYSTSLDAGGGAPHP